MMHRITRAHRWWFELVDGRNVPQRPDDLRIQVIADADDRPAQRPRLLLLPKLPGTSVVAIRCSATRACCTEHVR